MKTKLPSLFAWLLPALIAVALFAVVPSAIAQDAPPPDVAEAAGGPTISTGNVTADNIVSWLTPILVPLIIAGFKKLAPSIPSWSLPMIAPILGVILGVVNQLASGHAGNLWVAALLGLAGVGVREIKDQISPAPPRPVVPTD